MVYVPHPISFLDMMATVKDKRHQKREHLEAEKSVQSKWEAVVAVGGDHNDELLDTSHLHNITTPATQKPTLGFVPRPITFLDMVAAYKEKRQQKSEKQVHNEWEAAVASGSEEHSNVFGDFDCDNVNGKPSDKVTAVVAEQEDETRHL